MLANKNLIALGVTGDGDTVSIGAGQFVHLMRRNLPIIYVIEDNGCYGLTKGQYSPTSEVGKKANSTPFGSVDRPFAPLAVALGAGATFIAQSVDVFQPHLKSTLKRVP